MPAESPTRAGREQRDAGSATMELALAMPAVVLLLAVVLAAARLILVQLDCVDAARAGARAAARGETTQVVRAAATGRAPAGAVVRISAVDGTVVVSVSSRQSLGSELGGMFAAGARATAAVETR